MEKNSVREANARKGTEPVDILLMWPLHDTRSWYHDLIVDNFEKNIWQILITVCKLEQFLPKPRKMASACNAHKHWIQAALRNSLHHFIHISGLNLKQKLCLETVAQTRVALGTVPTGSSFPIVRSVRVSWCGTLIRSILRLLQSFSATVCY